MIGHLFISILLGVLAYLIANIAVPDRIAVLIGFIVGLMAYFGTGF